ncbi:MAG TPA: fimbria/pilus periplasmic chaperone [Scandinavium sp.]
MRPATSPLFTTNNAKYSDISGRVPFSGQPLLATILNLGHHYMRSWLSIFTIPLLLTGSLAYAANGGGVTIGGTRLVFNGANKEASLSVSNSAQSPYLIQSWAEDNDGNSSKLPFIVTPPLFRLNGNQDNILRVLRTRERLPEDRESLFWLNIKAIPSGSDVKGQNALQIAVKTKVKLIFRPASLNGNPEEVTSKLTWSQSGNKLTVTNPTAFIMNFSQVKVGGHRVKDATYVLAKSQATFTLSEGASGQISWTLISDYGGLGEAHTFGN